MAFFRLMTLYNLNDVLSSWNVKPCFSRGGGLGQKHDFLIKNFMEITMLFTGFENLVLFSRYLLSKMVEMTIFGPK